MHILAYWSQSLYSFIRHLVYIYPFIAWPPRCLPGWAEYNDNKSGFNGIGFLIQVVSDTVPSPANLNTGGKAAALLYLMCGGWGALQHLLASRPTALTNGRHRRPHDQLLKAVVDMVSTVREANNSHSVKSSLNFLRPGENCPEQKTLLGCELGLDHPSWVTRWLTRNRNWPQNQWRCIPPRQLKDTILIQVCDTGRDRWTTTVTHLQQKVK